MSKPTVLTTTNRHVLPRVMSDCLVLLWLYRNFVLFCFAFIWNILWTMTQQLHLKDSFSLKPLSQKVISPFLPFIDFAFCIYFESLIAPCHWYICFLSLHRSFTKLKDKSNSTFSYNRWLSNFIMHWNKLKCWFKKKKSQTTWPHHQFLI